MHLVVDQERVNQEWVSSHDQRLSEGAALSNWNQSSMRRIVERINGFGTTLWGSSSRLYQNGAIVSDDEVGVVEMLCSDRVSVKCVGQLETFRASNGRVP